MDIKYTSRKIEIDQIFKDRLGKKIDSLDRFFEGIVTAHVIFSQPTKLKQKVEISLRLNNQKKITSSASDVNIGKAADLAINKLAVQLKKINDKLKSHKKGRGKTPIFEEQLAGGQ